MTEIIYDVLIVGGGLAGLRTTQLLKEQGYNVLCLEANNVTKIGIFDSNRQEIAAILY
jgi:succinate dehydrogenase/fumarate reductase flavoprotein subunit